MRGVAGVSRIDRVDADGVFLANTGVNALGAGALDAGSDAEFFLEGFGDGFGKLQIGRGVPDHAAFLFRRLDQRRRDCLRRGSAARTGAA